MSYEFTITDTFNKSETEILREAILIAKSEIEQQELDPDLTVRLDRKEEEEQRIVYSFSLVPQEKSNIDNETLSSILGQKSGSEGIAAAQI